MVDWKKDIKLSNLLARGKGDSGEVDEATAFDQREASREEAVDEGATAETPFWKRELGFRRQKDEVETDPAGGTDYGAPVTASKERTPFWRRELSFGRRNDEETFEGPELEELAHTEPEPAGALVPEVGAADEIAFARGEPAPEEPEAVGAAVPELDLVEESRGEVEQPSQEAPEAIAAAYPESDPVEETPFWKRELKFGRRRGDADLGPPVLGREPEREELSSDNFEAPVEQEKKPFFKRGLSFGRAKDPDFDAPESEKRSLFKRDLSFGHRKRDSEADPDFAVALAEKRPFFKRELSFGRAKGGGRDLTAKRPGGRTKQLVGLKVGASQIAAARIVNSGSPELVQLARQSIEQGIVVGGELRDPEALAEALRDFFTKHKLPTRNVRLGIGNNRIGVRSFEISGVHDPKQLENAIRFRAQEALPIPLDEAVLDYHVVAEAVSPTGIRTYRVLLVVAYRELIDRYVAACRDAGVRLVGIDLEAFALLRALSPPPAEGFPEDTALVAVSIGHDRSTFAVSNGTVCEFTRVLDWGGSSLNTAIARGLDLTPSQAEPVKRTLSLNRGERGANAPSDEHTARAEEAVRLELQSFARELVSSLHFYQNQPGSLAIGSVMLTGGTAHLPGLAAELQRLIGVKVRVGDPLRRVKAAKRVEAPDQVGSMSVAIGLGIED